MTEKCNILIVGLGAIGRIYASKFYNSGEHCLKILVDEHRLKKYSKEGIFYNNKEFFFDYVLPETKDYKADIIIIATKSYHLKDAIDMIRNFVDDNTTILSLLNGISSENYLIKAYGEDKVIYSYYVGHASVKDGNNVIYDGIGKIVFGQNPATQNISASIEKISSSFDKAEIDYEVSEEMNSSMWQKFVMNIGINQTSAILNANYNMLQTSKKARDLAVNLMTEAVDLAKAIGIPKYDDFIENTFKLIDNMPKDLKPSMLQDIENNRKTEVDTFAGEVMRLGAQYKVSTPHNDRAYKLIKEKESRMLSTV